MNRQTRQTDSSLVCGDYICGPQPYVSIENTIKNNTAYVHSWLKAFKNDKRMSVIAASQAQLVADDITNE
jgi:antirestriction protein ArdC